MPEGEKIPAEKVIIETEGTLEVMKDLVAVERERLKIDRELLEEMRSLNRNLDVIGGIGSVVKTFIGKRK